MLLWMLYLPAGVVFVAALPCRLYILMFMDHHCRFYVLRVRITQFGLITSSSIIFYEQNHMNKLCSPSLLNVTLDECLNSIRPLTSWCTGLKAPRCWSGPPGPPGPPGRYEQLKVVWRRPWSHWSHRLLLPLRCPRFACIWHHFQWRSLWREKAGKVEEKLDPHGEEKNSLPYLLVFIKESSSPMWKHFGKIVHVKSFSHTDTDLTFQHIIIILHHIQLFFSQHVQTFIS